MNSKIFYLTYASSATSRMTNDEIVELLKKCRQTNNALGISGLLLHKDGNFMQTIEGQEEVVRQLAEKIYRDPRHKGIIKMLEGYVDERQFSDWSMGFQDLNSPELKSLEGVSDFLDQSLMADQLLSNPSRCQKLMLSFRKLHR